MDAFPIELTLTTKIVWLSSQIEKENKWYSTYDYKLKNRKMKPSEVQRISDGRDQCEKKIQEYIDKLFEALTIAETQFLETTNNK